MDLCIIVLLLQRLNSAIVFDRDYQYQYFGFKTLERSYLLRINGKGEAVSFAMLAVHKQLGHKLVPIWSVRTQLGQWVP